MSKLKKAGANSIKPGGAIPEERYFLIDRVFYGLKWKVN
jgi:hypothetical protein